MNVEEAADGTVIVSHDGRWLTTVMLMFAALFFAVAGYDVFFSARGTDRLLGVRPDADGSVMQIAGRIRVLLGHDAAPTHHSHVVDALMRPPTP